MLQYIIILLDDTCASFCHYDVTVKDQKLIDYEVLKAGIIFAMKENLNVQFVFPDYELPALYTDLIESIDHACIKPESVAKNTDVVVLNKWQEEIKNEMVNNATCIIRANRQELKTYKENVKLLLSKVSRLNVVLIDIEDFSDDDISDYENYLIEMTEYMVNLYHSGRNVQLNLLTDRAMLPEMNNCNAGVGNITLAPNGKFYLCPAFYYKDPNLDVGSLSSGLDIKNKQLLRLDHAPICRICDAYQCKRCIYLNERLTLEYNTPSHQQCVIAHLERNATREFLKRLDRNGIRIDNCQIIKEMKELDPFNTLQ